MGHTVAGIGGLDGVPAHAREVFRVAIVAGAAAVILAHNHPSGDPDPSEADLAVTRKMRRAGGIIGIEVADHIVVGRAGASRKRDFVSVKHILAVLGDWN